MSHCKSKGNHKNFDQIDKFLVSLEEENVDQ